MRPSRCMCVFFSSKRRHTRFDCDWSSAVCSSDLSLAARGLMEEIRRLAEPLAGKRVAHVSATAFGGGVAEINYTLVPLMQSAGLEVEGRITRGQEAFFNVTQTIHKALHGHPQGLTEDDP